MIVNNPTKINKAKENVYSDSQQFHQDQQNKENLYSDSQQFHQDQQNKRKVI